MDEFNQFDHVPLYVCTFYLMSNKLLLLEFRGCRTEADLLMEIEP